LRSRLSAAIMQCQTREALSALTIAQNSLDRPDGCLISHVVLVRRRERITAACMNKHLLSILFLFHVNDVRTRPREDEQTRAAGL
jgi:hypothetical protein